MRPSKAKVGKGPVKSSGKAPAQGTAAYVTRSLSRAKAVAPSVGIAAENAMSLQAASTLEYEMSDFEVNKLRRTLYMINRNHPKGYKFRTMREGSIIIIWRIA